jgi:hypothetical protein
MPFTPFAAPVVLTVQSLQGDTGPAGFALQNATPNILTWNVPNDGKAHTFIVQGQVHATVAETGGAIQIAYTQPDGNAQTTVIDAGGHGISTSGLGSSGNFSRVVQAGSTVILQQGSALTAGTAVLFATLWGV